MMGCIEVAVFALRLGTEQPLEVHVGLGSGVRDKLGQVRPHPGPACGVAPVQESGGLSKGDEACEGSIETKAVPRLLVACALRDHV